MLTTDLIVEVKSTRTIRADQVAQLERMIFANGAPAREHVDLLVLLDAYVRRAAPAWAALLARAAGSQAARAA